MGRKAREMRIRDFFKLFIYGSFCQSLEEEGPQVCPALTVTSSNTAGSVALLWGNHFVPWACYLIDLRPHLDPPNMYVADLGGDIAQLLLWWVWFGFNIYSLKYKYELLVSEYSFLSASPCTIGVLGNDAIRDIN